jgi:hypothetical protein
MRVPGAREMWLYRVGFHTSSNTGAALRQPRNGLSSIGSPSAGNGPVP